MNKFAVLITRFTKIFTGEVSISGMHFVLSLVLLRHLTLNDYGIFAMIFLVGGIIYAYIDGFCTSPLSAYSMRKNSIIAQRYYEVIFGSVSFLVIIAVFFIALLIIWLLQKDLVLALLASLALALCGARALMRGLFYSRNFARKAVIGDFTYALAGFILIGFVFLNPEILNIQTALGMIIIPQLVSMAVSFIIKGEKVKLSFKIKSFKQYQKLAIKPALWDSLTTTISFAVSHTQSFLVAALFGASIYAPLAAGLVLFGPFRTVALALGNTLRPDFSRSLANKDHKSIVTSLSFGLGGMTLLCVGYLIFIWLFWDYIYQFLFAARFSNVSIEVIIFLNGIAALLYTNANVFQFYLQAKMLNKTITYARTMGAIVALLTIFPLLLTLPIAYSLFSLILAEGVSLIYLGYIVYRDVILRVPNMPNNIANTK